MCLWNYSICTVFTRTSVSIFWWQWSERVKILSARLLLYINKSDALVLLSLLSLLRWKFLKRTESSWLTNLSLGFRNETVPVPTWSYLWRGAKPIWSTCNLQAQSSCSKCRTWKNLETVKNTWNFQVHVYCHTSNWHPFGILLDLRAEPPGVAVAGAIDGVVPSLAPSTTLRARCPRRPRKLHWSHQRQCAWRPWVSDCFESLVSVIQAASDHSYSNCSAWFSRQPLCGSIWATLSILVLFVEHVEGRFSTSPRNLHK